MPGLYASGRQHSRYTSKLASLEKFDSKGPSSPGDLPEWRKYGLDELVQGRDNLSELDYKACSDAPGRMCPRLTDSRFKESCYKFADTGNEK